MRKKSKSTGKVKKQKKDEGFMFFVPDQGEGAAKVIVIILKVIMLIITSICALCFGILGPVCIWIGEYDPAIVENPAILTWLISSCIYIVKIPKFIYCLILIIVYSYKKHNV